MKHILFALVFMSSLSASASILEIAVSIQEKATANSITINKDGSVTLKNISVMRGDGTYPIGISNEPLDYTSTCKLLGFDSILVGEGLNTYATQRGPKVFLKTDGSYSNTKNYAYQIEKVTCFKMGQLKTVVQFDRVENADKSSKVTHIRYLRGDLAYPIGINNESLDYTSTCKILGFDSSLAGDDLNIYSSQSGTKVFLKTDGSYLATGNTSYQIEKATCFADVEPSLVVLVEGNRYMRVIP